MSKFIVKVKHVEYFEGQVLVQANSEAEAEEKVRKEFYQSDYLYDRITDCATEHNTKFFTPHKRENCPHIADSELINIDEG